MGKFFSLVWVKRTVRIVLVTASSFFLVFVVNGSVNASAKDLSGAWEITQTFDVSTVDARPARTIPPVLFNFSDGTVTTLDEDFVALGSYTLLSGNPRNPTVEDVYELVYIVDVLGNREYPDINWDFTRPEPERLINPPEGRGFLGCPDFDLRPELGGLPEFGAQIDDAKCYRIRKYHLVTLSADGDSLTSKSCTDIWMIDSVRNPSRKLEDARAVYNSENPPLNGYCEESGVLGGAQKLYFTGGEEFTPPNRLNIYFITYGLSIDDGSGTPSETATSNTIGTRITP